MTTPPTETFSDSLPRYADIMLDDWFKRSFQEYSHAKRLLQLTLQALIPERKIVSLTYAPQESTNQNAGKKGIRVDVECVDDNGQRFVVEVQRSTQQSFYGRAVFNSTFAIQRQIAAGRSYKFPPVYFIGIMRFSVHPSDGRFLYRYSLADDETGERMTEDLHYIFLETPKCRDWANATELEKFGYALQNFPRLRDRPEGFEGEWLDLLFSSAEISNFTPEEKIKYENDMTTERDIRNQIDYAFDKGKAEGVSQGIQQGMQQGKLNIARAMLIKGLDTDMISSVTGLAAEEIMKLNEK